MELAEEWNKRILIWLEELKNHIFFTLEEIRFDGFITKDQLSYEEALQQKFSPMPEGTCWGAKWEYGWFQTEFMLPKEAEGHRIFLHPNVGGEMLLWVNGKTAGSRDLKHEGITLTQCGKEGERFFIVAESYAGHGPRLENGGPCPPERVAVPEPSVCQAAVGKSDFGIWNEDAFQLLLDVFTLNRLYQGLDSKSLRAMKVREGLIQFTQIVDFEQNPEKRNKTFQKAREILKPFLSCVNGSTAPEFTIFGQSHLDLAWLWPWEETKRKCARTLSTQIALSDEYEDYKFLLCEPPIMENVKEYYPELYSRLLEKVKEGSFVPEGGMYVEPDTNLVSGESLIRQCLYGRKWFREELGIESVMVWLPDCFGFNGQLPQIMKGCGIRYFTTQKIARALKGCDVFPYNTFWWEGIDGTRILTHFYKKNNARLDPFDLLTRWNEDRVQQEHIDCFLYPFGFGDGGGGATREMVEIANRLKDLEGAPRTRMESPVKFFERLEEHTIEEVYRGELYLPWHRGTYTSQARIKKENRRLEWALREAEFWNGVGCMNGLVENKRSELESLWKILLFNQFHDIIPGTSITRVYEDAFKELGKLKKKVNQLCQEARKELTYQEDSSLMVFNSLSWEREELVEFPAEYSGDFIKDGKHLVHQRVGNTVLVPVKVPSCGFTSIATKGDVSKEQPVLLDKRCSIYEEKGRYILENALVKAVIDRLGQVTSFVEKETGTDFAAGICNQLCMYQDINVDYDAWEMSTFYHELPVVLEDESKIRIQEVGPLFVILEVKRLLHDSPMTQQIILKYNSRRLDFVTKIKWIETHKLLKAGFSVPIHTDQAIEEIQFGYVKRPTHQNRRFDADRFEVCNHRYTALTEPGRTAAVLNDCKYGISTSGNTMELTLLKAPVWPDMHADKGMQEFTYSFYTNSVDFADSGVIQEGLQLNHPLSFGGTGAGEREYFNISADNVILETLKMAEDGSNHMVLRLYEAAGKHTAGCTLGVNYQIKEAYQTTMEEKIEEGKRILLKDQKDRRKLQLDFAPFEIKTIRILP